MVARIFVVHPTTLTFRPLEEAFVRAWPEAARFNILDESLYGELDAEGTITPGLCRRLRLLFDYCVMARADAIICNGVTFGPAIDEARQGLAVPVVKPVEAIAALAVAAGRNIAVMTASARSMPTILREIEAAARSPIHVEKMIVSGAQAALVAGDSERHDALIVAAAAHFSGIDALALAQAPMASAAPAIANARPGMPVLVTTDSAVNRVRQLLGAD